MWDVCDFDAGLAATLHERFVARLTAVRTATGLSDAELGLARVFPEPVYTGPVYAGQVYPGPTSTEPTDIGAVSALTSAEDLHHTAATADPLAAVPVLVKDLHQVAGQVTSFGSHHHARVASHHDAPVEALLARGAQLVGMTSTAEFGTAAYTEPVGSKAPVNPLGEQFMCGGSSGGAAVAVAHGIVPVAHATDGGGSIRIPAACVGLPALKPAHVAFDPLREGFSPVAQGFITQDFAWLRHAGTMAGPIRDTRVSSSELASTTLRQRLRIGVTTQPFHAATQVDPRISSATQLAGQVLLQYPETLSVTPTQAPYPRSSFTAFADILALRCADLPEPLTPLTAWLRNRGRNTPAHHLPQLIAHLRQLQAMPAWQDFDVILTPMLSTAPPPPGSFSALSPAENFAAQTAWTPWATLWNLTGWAGITVPLIPAADCPGRWPIAVHLGAVGQRISEAELISLAEWLQQQFRTMLQSPEPHRRLCLDDVTLSEPGSIQIPQIY